MTTPPRPRPPSRPGLARWPRPPSPRSLPCRAWRATRTAPPARAPASCSSQAGAQVEHAPEVAHGIRGRQHVPGRALEQPLLRAFAVVDTRREHERLDAPDQWHAARPEPAVDERQERARDRLVLGARISTAQPGSGSTRGSSPARPLELVGERLRSGRPGGRARLQAAARAARRPCRALARGSRAPRAPRRARARPAVADSASTTAASKRRAAGSSSSEAAGSGREDNGRRSSGSGRTRCPTVAATRRERRRSAWAGESGGRGMPRKGDGRRPRIAIRFAQLCGDSSFSILAVTALLGLAGSGSGGSATSRPRAAIFYYPWYGTAARDGGWQHWNQLGHRPPLDLASNFYPGPRRLLERRRARRRARR